MGTVSRRVSLGSPGLRARPERLGAKGAGRRWSGAAGPTGAGPTLDRSQMWLRSTGSPDAADDEARWSLRPCPGARLVNRPRDRIRLSRGASPADRPRDRIHGGPGIRKPDLALSICIPAQSDRAMTAIKAMIERQAILSHGSLPANAETTTAVSGSHQQFVAVAIDPPL